MTTPKRAPGEPELGKGLSVKEWLKKPNRPVTRRELWLFLKAYDGGRQRVAHEQAWHRRLWRWLRTPVVRLPGPPA